MPAILSSFIESKLITKKMMYHKKHFTKEYNQTKLFINSLFQYLGFLSCLSQGSYPELKRLHIPDHSVRNYFIEVF